MARMRQRLIRGRQCVIITGNLCARDLRRLEMLCGRSLEQQPMPLPLRLRAGSTVDHPAQATWNVLSPAVR